MTTAKLPGYPRIRACLPWILIITPFVVGLGFYLEPWFPKWSQIFTDPVKTFIQAFDEHRRMLILVAGVFLSGVIAIVCSVRYLVKRAYKNLMRQWMQRKQQLLSEEHERFHARLDHELRNPLQSILSGVETLSLLLDHDSEEGMIVRNVGNSTARLMSTFGDLRLLAELEKRHIAKEEVEVTEVLTDIFTDAQQHPNSQNRELSLTLPKIAASCTIKAEAGLVMIMLRNLVENALKYTEAGDSIELRAFRSRNEVVVQVADTGPGIPKQDIANIWKELWRGPHAKPISGSGMGLPLVRTIVNRHNGYVNVESGQGKGALFTVGLPVSS